MSVGIIRPEVSQLMLHLFDRSLHPELFDVRTRRTISQENYEATLSLCDAGHLIAFRYGDRTITEVLAADAQPLPEKNQLFHRTLSGSRNESRLFEGGVRYQICHQTEQLDPEVFAKLTEELSSDSRRADLAFRFPTGNRLAPTPLSLIQADIQADGLLLHVFHTFPACRSVVRTQTLFEL